VGEFKGNWDQACCPNCRQRAEQAVSKRSCRRESFSAAVARPATACAANLARVVKIPAVRCFPKEHKRLERYSHAVPGVRCFRKEHKRLERYCNAVSFIGFFPKGHKWLERYSDAVPTVCCFSKEHKWLEHNSGGELS